MTPQEILVTGHHRRHRSRGLIPVIPHARRRPRGSFVSSGEMYRLDSGVPYRDFKLSPREFLRLVEGERTKAEEFDPEYGTQYEKFLDEGYTHLMNRMRKGQEMDALTLVVGPSGNADSKDPRIYKVRGHEGRHRAASAARLGIPRVPVRIYFREADPSWYQRLVSPNTSIIRPQFDYYGKPTRAPRGVKSP